MLSRQIAISKGQNKPMSVDHALKITLPIEGYLQEVRRKGFNVTQAYHVMEYFFITAEACFYTIPVTTDESKHLVEERAKQMLGAAQEALKVFERVKAGGSGACSLKTLDVLDEAFGVSANLHEVLPQWAFMKAMRKVELGRMQHMRRKYAVHGRKRKLRRKK